MTGALQNRVLPTGEIVADKAYRGTLMGNRGILHDATQRLGRRRWTHKAWISCLLSFKGRRWVPMSPGRYTELFFLDEAVAMAAGHRPCAECRRADFTAFSTAWAAGHGEFARATAMDAALHGARVARTTRAQFRHDAALDTLPDGSFILSNGEACLVWHGAHWPFSPRGYGSARPLKGSAPVRVLTPRPMLSVLRAGYVPGLHPSVGN